MKKNLLLTLVFSCILHASEELSFDQLINIYSEVITTSRHKQDFLSSPSFITVIPGREIENFESIPQALKFLANADYQKVNEFNEDVSFRGFNRPYNDLVLILLDSKPFFNDWSGGVFWDLLPVTPGEIDRIEIIKGPAASLYGLNAAAGVINIITKPDTENHFVTSHKFDKTFGDYDGGSYSLVHTTKFSPEKQLKISAFSKNADSSTENGSFLTKVGQYYPTDPTFYKNTSDSKKINVFNLDYDRLLKKDRSLNFSLSDSRNSTYFPGILPDENGYAGPTDLSLQTFTATYGKNYSHNLDRTITLTCKNLNQSATKLYNNAGADITAANNTDDLHAASYNLEFKRSILHLPKNPFRFSGILTYGAHSGYSSLSGFLFGNKKNSVSFNSVFIQEEIEIRKILLNLGARYDEHSKYKARISPRYSMIFKNSPHTSIRMSYNKALKNPDLYNYFFDAKIKELFGLKAYYHENPDAGPTVTENRELSFNFENDRTQGSLTFFSTSLSGWTDFDDLSNAETQKFWGINGANLHWYWVNVLNLKNRGAELVFRHRLSDNLSMRFNYIDQRVMRQRNSRITFTFEPNRLTGDFRDTQFFTPHISTNTAFNYQNKKFNCDFYWLRTSSRHSFYMHRFTTLKPLNEANINLGYRFSPSVKASLALQNLFSSRNVYNGQDRITERSIIFSLEKEF